MIKAYRVKILKRKSKNRQTFCGNIEKNDKVADKMANKATDDESKDVNIDSSVNYHGVNIDNILNKNYVNINNLSLA